MSQKRIFKQTKTALFSIDVELYALNVSRCVNDFLRILDRLAIPATFFMTGEVLKSDRSIAKRIVCAGHELASHGYTFVTPKSGPLLDRVSPQIARKEIKRSKECFDEAGFDIQGFRATALKISKETLNDVARYFTHDSSTLQRRICDQPYELPNGLFEIPVSRYRVINLPVSTSTLMFTGSTIASLIARCGRYPGPLVFYAHSFDLSFGAIRYIRPSTLKSWVYYRWCGPERLSFFQDLLISLQRFGYSFSSHAEFMQSALKIK